MQNESCPLIVMKFGGSSVGNAQAMLTTARLIAGALDTSRVVAVVSAMGSLPTKVTDLLIQAAQTAAEGDDQTHRAIAGRLTELHRDVILETLPDTPERDALLDEVADLIDMLGPLCHSIYVLGEVTPRALDTVSAMGERLSARIVATILRNQGVDAEAVEATELIVTDEQYGDASPLMEQTREKMRSRLLPVLKRDGVPVLTGFIGATERGIITTLGRGGSDFTATIAGACLDAVEIWIWSDVDGVLTTDPRLVKEARCVPRLSFDEMAELSYFGAKVLHTKAVAPAEERNIPLRLKNTFNPAHPGTLVVRDSEQTSGTIKSVTLIKNLSLLTVAGRGMIGVPGIAAAVFTAVAHQGVNILMISQGSSEQSICFMISEGDAPRAKQALERELALELHRHTIERITIQDPVSIVAVVGAGMAGTPGVAARVFGALGKEEINVMAIAQGSSEYNISLVVRSEDGPAAVRAIHQELDL